MNAEVIVFGIALTVVFCLVVTTVIIIVDKNQSVYYSLVNLIYNYKTKDKKMNYYKLTNGTSWNLVDTNSINIDKYRQIKLYDDNLEFYGMGLY